LPAEVKSNHVMSSDRWLFLPDKSWLLACSWGTMPTGKLISDDMKQGS